MSVNKFIETNKLESKVKINPTGGFDIPVNLFEETVLQPLKVKKDTYDKLMQETNTFNAALVQVAGNQAADHFKANADISELAFNYEQGNWNNNTVFTRGTTDAPSNVVTEIATVNEELKTIQTGLIELFNNLDN